MWTSGQQNGMRRDVDSEKLRSANLRILAELCQNGRTLCQRVGLLLNSVAARIVASNPSPFHLT